MSDARDNQTDRIVDLTRRRSVADGSAPPDRDSTPSPITDPDGHLSAETLSAWLDDPADLEASARTLVEEHLADCAVCQATVGELRAIVDGLATLPLVDPPRSFALTPELLDSTARTSEHAPVRMTETRAWYARQLTALRWATAVAAVLFVFVLGADFFTRGVGNGSDDDLALQPVTEQSSAAGAAEEAAPMVATEAAATDAEAADDAAGSVPQEESGDTSTTLQAPATESTSDAARTTDGEAEAADESTIAAYADDTTAGKQAGDAAGEDDARSTLRLLQVGLALAIVWLLAAIIAIPRLRPRDR